MPDSRILLGVIGRAHGVRGLVRVTSHTADPADLTAYDPLTDAKGRRFALRWRGEGIAEVSEIVGGRAEKVSDRTAAERLTNTQLFIDRAQLPPADEDEFYLADLIGLSAFTQDGAALGRVAVVHDYGAGTSIEIERDDAPPLIVPFTHACVPVVDVAGRRLVLVEPDIASAPEGPLDPSESTAPAGTPVMAGLDPTTHPEAGAQPSRERPGESAGLDGRVKSGHDGGRGAGRGDNQDDERGAGEVRRGGDERDNQWKPDDGPRVPRHTTPEPADGPS